MDDASRQPLWPPYLLFTVSGAAGLVYEVIWMRMLAVTLGATAPAVAAVLAAFMGGLALGSWLGGRAVDRWGRPLLWYAAAEAFIGVYALVFPALAGGLDGFARAVYHVDAPAARELLRFAVATAILVAPAAAMGATTPAVVAAVRARHPGGGTAPSFSAAYAANTLGGALGVVAGGLWLLWALGARGALVALAGVNGLVAAAAFTLGRRREALPRAEAALPAAGRVAVVTGVAAFVAGGVALAAQVLWTRALASVVGSATYAFATILAVILVAIAAGALVHRRLLARGVEAGRLYVTLCLGSGAALAASIFALKEAPYLFLLGFGASRGLFGETLALVAALAVLVLFLPSFTLGMVLPATVAAAGGGAGGTGRRVGVLYSCNTAGAILGGLAGTFLLLPTLGAVGGLRALAVAVLAAAFLFGVTRRRARWLVPGVVVAGAGAIIIPGPSRHELALGAGISPSYYLDARGRLALGDVADERLLYYRDSVDASAAVVAYGDVRALKINGKTVASTNYDDLRVEKMLGALPLAACPGARDVLVIGLGTGITLGACAASPAPVHIVCVEINPAVAAASRYFDRWSGAPLDDPRVRFRRDDGRSYVLATDERFDVITSDPIHPWTKGSSALYTVEHFQGCARLLRPGGVMAQWLPLYQLSPDDYFTVVNSFARAFPRVGLWFSGRDTVLLGKRDAGPWPAAYAPYLVAEGPKLRAAAARYHLNTEDRLRLEFTAPRSLYEKTEYPNLGELLALREPGGDDRYLAVNELLAGRQLNLAGDAAAAEAAFARALRLWPDNEDVRQALADIYFERGLTAAAGGNDDAARLWFTRVLQLTPGDTPARANLEQLDG